MKLPSLLLSRSLPTLIALLVPLSLPCRVFAQSCPSAGAGSRQQLPTYSSNVGGLSTAGGTRYLYAATQYGIARASLQNPAAPSNPTLGQVGLKFSNGGIVPMPCDCWSMAQSFGVAEAPDGSVRTLMDNLSSHQGGGLPAQVVSATSSGSLGFGQQVNANLPRPGTQIAAITLPTGKFIGYLPPDEQNASIQVLDLTNVNGDPDPSSALRPFATALSWGGPANVVLLQAVNIQGNLLLFGALAGENTLRVARIDPSTGIPAALPATVAVNGGFQGFSVAVVDGRTFVFVSEYGLGLHIFEYTGSAFVSAAVIPGSFRSVIVRGTQFPVMFVVRVENQTFIDLYGTKFLTQGGSVPTSPAFSLPQRQFLGDSMEAVVTTSGSSSTAYLYRLATRTGSETEVVIQTTPINVSCLSADTTSPPTANANFTNLSAASRSGAEATTNYYGDVVKFTDASATGQPITRVDWDVLTTGTFSADAAVGTGTTVQGIYPCDATQGSWNTAGCAASAFPGGPPASANAVFAEKSTNVNGQSSNTFFSAPILFKKPQIQITGLDQALTLHVLSGGTADASSTQGNYLPSGFQWSFNGAAVPGTGSVVSVPAGALTFSVTATWPGGYTNSVGGGVIQTDLVPAFTLSPNPVGLGGTVTLTNRMQIAPAATLGSTEVSVAPGGCPTATPQYSPLNGNFNQRSGNGTSVTVVPATQGAYCVTVRYNYTSGGSSTSQAASQPLAISATLAPLSCSPSSISVGGSVTCTTSGGSGSYRWNWGEFGQPFVDGPAQNQHNYIASGNFTIVVQDASSPTTFVQANVNVTGVVNPPPPPPPPPSLTVAVSGPTSGAPNSPLVFSASASGGTGAISYAWACDFNPLVGSGQFVPGGSSVTCPGYPSQGVHAVGVRVTDSANATATNSTAITITGPSLPSTAFTVTGAAFVSGGTYQVGVGQEVVFTSSEPSASSWGWDFGDATAGSGRTVRKAYSAKGTYTGRLIVTGNGTGSSGLAIGTFTIQVITPAPSGAFTILRANPNSAGTVYTASVGEEITMSSSETHALSWGWDFGDQTFGGASSVKKTYNAIGTYTLQLIVTGDGVSTTGTTISRFTVNVVSCVSSGTTLCLNNNRFRATVNWAVPDQQKSGEGVAVALTGDTGYYWFFSPTNIELVLKVVDGRAANGKFWVFYGALSDVQYTITIKDTTTGAVKTYSNPYHTTASVADTNAFNGGTSPSSKVAEATTAGPTLTCSPSSVVVNNPVSCSVTGASGGASFRWAWDFCLGGCLVDGSNPQSHTYTTPGVQSVTCVVTDGPNVTTLTASANVTAAPAGGLSAAISGPAAGTTSDTLSYSANATSGTAPYSYSWACDYGVAPAFAAGEVSKTCSFSTAGTHTIGLKVTDSAGSPAQFIATKNVVVSAPAGPGLPSAAFSLDGATLNSATGRYEAENGKTLTFTAAEPNANLYGWAFGDGLSGSGKTVTHAYPQGGTFNGQLVVNGDGTRTTGISVANIPLSILACASDGKTLCLNGGRFKVRVDWRSDSSSGFGTAVPVTADTGEFWFLSSNNIELMLKVVDGTSFNGHFWVFYGALSDLEYTIAVTDTTTGTVKTYHNPLHTTASVADVNAF